MSSLIVALMVLGTIYTKLSFGNACAINVTTPSFYSYQHVSSAALVQEGDNSTRFFVKACSDAHVLLSASNSSNDLNVYEIVIGGWSNTQSVIRKAKQGASLASVLHVVLSCTEWRHFYVKWQNGVVEVGNVTAVVTATGTTSSLNRFLVYRDSLPPVISDVFVSGWNGIPGQWSFGYQCPLTTTSSNMPSNTSNFSDTTTRNSETTVATTSSPSTTETHASIETSTHSNANFNTTNANFNTTNANFNTTNANFNTTTAYFNTTTANFNTTTALVEESSMLTEMSTLIAASEAMTTRDYFSSTRWNQYSLCDCECSKTPYVNKTRLSEIVAELALDKKTSQMVRRYYSASDRRLSSAAIGVIAVICGGAPFVFVIAMDAINLWNFMSSDR